MILLIIILLIRSVVLKNNRVPEKLFVEALKNENSGDFEAAVILYDNALHEVKKGKLHDFSLENKIIEKIKVLHMTIDYKNNLQFTR
jgi:hypothetical protein